MSKASYSKKHLSAKESIGQQIGHRAALGCYPGLEGTQQDTQHTKQGNNSETRQNTNTQMYHDKHAKEAWSLHTSYITKNNTHISNTIPHIMRSCMNHESS